MLRHQNKRPNFNCWSIWRKKSLHPRSRCDSSSGDPENRKLLRCFWTTFWFERWVNDGWLTAKIATHRAKNLWGSGYKYIRWKNYYYTEEEPWLPSRWSAVPLPRQSPLHNLINVTRLTPCDLICVILTTPNHLWWFKCLQTFRH